MTLLVLVFRSERTCVWACMCAALHDEAGENPHNHFWEQNGQTHGFICCNNSLATFSSGTLKTLSQSCHTSLTLLNTFPGSSLFRGLGFRPWCATVLCHSWFNSSFSLVLFHMVTSCTSDLRHLLQLFSFPVSLSLLRFMLVSTMVRRRPASI